MPRAAKQLEWCTVRLGEDANWWVKEVSDDVHWDVDGLSIIDPRQIAHILDLVEPLNDYKYDADLLEVAFIPFRIQKDLGKGLIRLVRSNESFLDSDEPLFALPNVIDDENSPYADFLNNITKARVKLLNDLINFEQDLTIDEVEESIREEQNNSLIEGNAIHLFDEVTSILDYVPAGWELDDDDEDKSTGVDDDDDIDLPDIEEEDTSEISKDESLKWDEDEDEDEDDDDTYEGPPPSDDDDDDFDVDEDEEDDKD